MFRKYINYLTVVILILALLTGCSFNAPSTSSSANNNGESLTIVASFYPIYIFTLNVAKDIPNVKVINLTNPGTTGCLHDYSLTTEDMKNLEEARIFVINGAGMESFMDKVTGQMPNLKIVDSGKGVQLIKGEGNQEDNPHLWVSISNAIIQVRNIGNQLSALDPDNAVKYQANTADYIEKLEAEREKMHQVLDDIKNREIVTFHEAFPYFAKEFDLKIAGVIEREPGSEPNPKELADTIDIVKSLKVKALFAEPQYSATAADTIAQATGAKIFTLDPVVTGPMDADAYINIMDNNLKSLQEALK